MLNSVNTVKSSEFSVEHSLLIEFETILIEYTAKGIISVLSLRIDKGTGYIVYSFSVMLGNDMTDYFLHSRIVVDHHVIEFRIIVAVEYNSGYSCIFNAVDYLFLFTVIADSISKKYSSIEFVIINEFINIILAYIKKRISHYSAESREIGDIDVIFHGTRIDAFDHAVLILFIYTCDHYRYFDNFVSFHLYITSDLSIVNCSVHNTIFCIIPHSSSKINKNFIFS